MTVFAYARVSAQEQNIARQLDAFHNYGIDDKHIFADKKKELCQQKVAAFALAGHKSSILKNL